MHSLTSQLALVVALFNWRRRYKTAVWLPIRDAGPWDAARENIAAIYYEEMTAVRSKSHDV